MQHEGVDGVRAVSPKALLGSHVSFVKAVALSLDGKRLYSGGMGSKLCVWDTESNNLLRTFPTHGAHTIMAIACGKIDRTWLTESQFSEALSLFGKGTSEEHEFEFVVSAGISRTVQVWRPPSVPTAFEPIHELPVLEPVYALAVGLQ